VTGLIPFINFPFYPQRILVILGGEERDMEDAGEEHWRHCVQGQLVNIVNVYQSVLEPVPSNISTAISSFQH